MNYLIYISSAIKLMSNADLVKILSDSRDNNKTQNITGMLLYGDGVFIQVLEGEEEVIENVYHKIVKDPRHRSIIKLTSGDLNKRNFPDWTMGFIAVNEKELAKLDGYINPANKNFLATNNQHAALDALKTFAQNSKISGHL